MKFKALRLRLLIAVVLLLSACSGEVNGVPEPREESASSIASGRRLIASYGCGSCHSIPGIPGANAMAAPPLNRYYQRSYIAGRLPNTWGNLTKYIQDPQQTEPGSAMPDLGVSEDEAHDMAAYLYHRPALSDLINR
jgi:cytochrome c